MPTVYSLTFRAMTHLQRLQYIQYIQHIQYIQYILYEVRSKIFRTGAAIYTVVVVARSAGSW